MNSLYIFYTDLKRQGWVQCADPGKKSFGPKDKFDFLEGERGGGQGLFVVTFICKYN